MDFILSIYFIHPTTTRKKYVGCSAPSEVNPPCGSFPSWGEAGPPRGSQETRGGGFRESLEVKVSLAQPASEEDMPGRQAPERHEDHAHDVEHEAREEHVLDFDYVYPT